MRLVGVAFQESDQRRRDAVRSRPVPSPERASGDKEDIPAPPAGLLDILFSPPGARPVPVPAHPQSAPELSAPPVPAYYLYCQEASKVPYGGPAESTGHRPRADWEVAPSEVARQEERLLPSAVAPRQALPGSQ